MNHNNQMQNKILVYTALMRMNGVKKLLHLSPQESVWTLECIKTHKEQFSLLSRSSQEP